LFSNSVSQYRKSPQDSCKKLGGKYLPFLFNILVLGGVGFINGYILISLGLLLPFLKLQGAHAATTLLQFVFPPRNLGIT